MSLACGGPALADLESVATLASLDAAMTGLGNYNKPRGSAEARCPMAQAASRLPASEAMTTQAAGWGSSAPCPDYVDPNGQFGSKGATIDKIMQGPNKAAYDRLLLSDEAGQRRGMDKACPRWSALSASERRQFWVWTFAAISKRESACGTDARSQRVQTDVTGRKVAGEFQLNATYGDRYWRGAAKATGLKDRHCAKKGALLNFEDNAACALDIMAGQFAGEYSARNLKKAGLTGNAYWAQLRADGGKSPIVQDASRFKPCGGG